MFRFSFKTYHTQLRRRLDEKWYRSLYRVGAYVRRVARNSIRRSRGGASSPKGSKYPVSHTGAVKNFIRFGLTNDKTSVVIGPTLLPRPKSRTNPMTVAARRNATRLSILEFGGRQRLKNTGEVQRYEGRPFMQTALAKARNQNSLKGAFRDIGSV